MVRVILMTFYKMNQYVTKLYNCSGWKIRVELDLSSYPKKKKKLTYKITGVDTSKFAKRS